MPDIVIALSNLLSLDCSRHERICHSNQRHNRKSCSPRASGFWYDNCAVEPAQRRFLRVKQHDFGNGILLWRRCADYRRKDGVEEGQHFRYYCFFFLRFVLVLARNVESEEHTSELQSRG